MVAGGDAHCEHKPGEGMMGDTGEGSSALDGELGFSEELSL